MLLISIVMAAACNIGSIQAADGRDAVSDSLITKLRKLFNTDRRDSLYKITGQYREHNLATGNMHEYYQGWKFEILYDINFNNFYHAMRKTVKMSNDMKERKEADELYGATYLFGIIYSLQGNTSQAKECFHRAINEARNQNPVYLIPLYKELANVEMDEEPEQAIKNIDKAIKITQQAGLKYEYSDAIAFKMIIAFTMNDWKLVNSLYERYTAMQKEYGHEFSTTYHQYVMMCKYTADGKYNEALAWADKLTNIDKYKFRTTICELAGNMKMALEAQKRYIHVKDSVNSTIITQELNDAANDMEMNTMRTKAEKDRIKKKIMWLAILILTVVIVVLIFLAINRRRYTKTLRKKNNELEILRRKSEEAEVMKANILKNMSHEIRTPLNIISGFVQLICQPGFTPSDNEKADIAERITDSADSLVKIINNLLYVASKESESYAPRIDKVACNALCLRLVDRLDETLPEDVCLAFKTNVDDNFCITSNEKGIERILDNLLNNALKFTTQGNITLECCLSPDRKKLDISVTDTGMGVADNQKDHIFDVFYKAYDNKEGLGVGLPLAKHMARQLGGDLTLDHTYTGGARFILTITV